MLTAALDSPDAQLLIAQVQAEYVRRYGGPDETVLHAGEFAPPGGAFLVGRLDGAPAVCGGWRSRDGGHPGFRDGDAELKRMYVVPGARGRGLARALLAELERRAVAAGRRRLVLETGDRQPEAVALYTGAGYSPVPPFGVYREQEGAIHLGKELAGPAAPAGGPAVPAADPGREPAPVAERAAAGH